MKQGFTLIELLAVIVILAIIALIATPIVLNIIANTKENAQLRSAEMYLDAVEQAISIERMNNTTFKPNSCNINNGDLECEGYDKNPIVNYIVTKSGKYESIRNDGGIVSTIYGDYILTIFIKDFKDEDYRNDGYVYNQGKKISNIIFNDFIR